MNDALAFIRRDYDGSRYYACPMCGNEIKVEANTFFGRCPACLATLIDYKPKKHQESFHKSSAKYRLLIGGYGSGKTTASCAEIANHAMDISNGRSLITAPILSQIQDAVLPELIKLIPPWYIEKITLKPKPYIKLVNGHEIVIYASNDEQALRSLNLTAFYIEEASRVDFSVFVQLQARLRNENALVRDDSGNVIENHLMGIVCTNPDDCWVRDEFLMKSSKIFTSRSIDRVNYDKMRSPSIVEAFHTFISSSRDNDSLPPGYIQDLCAGKAMSWVRKYIDCYLDVKEGAVYSEFSRHIVVPFEIPSHWKRIYGFDKGFRDETALVCGAIDPQDGVIYVYDEYYVAEQPLSYHANQLKLMIDPKKLFLPIQADPSIRNRNDINGDTYQRLFQNASGLFLAPAENAILDGIEKVRDYMYLGKLKFFSNCANLKMEAGLYVYRDGGKNRANSTNYEADMPIDRFNHLMDALRYMISPLPSNPNEFNSVSMPTMSSKDIIAGMNDDTGGVYGGMRLWETAKKPKKHEDKMAFWRN